MQLPRCVLSLLIVISLAGIHATLAQEAPPAEPSPPGESETAEAPPVEAPPPGEAATEEAPPVEAGPPRADLSEANDLVRAGDYVRAEIVLAELGEEFPDDPRLLLLHGEVLLVLSQPTRALPKLLRAAELDGDRPRVHFQLATAMQATGDREGALAEFAKEIETNEDTQVRVMAHLNRMMLREQERDWAGAATELEAVLQLDPTQVQAYGDMATFYIQAGRLDDAAASLARGVEQGFQSAQHCYILGARYYEKKAFDQAIDAFRQALGIDPEMAEAERSLAGALDQAGREQEALAHFERYLELDPDAPDAERVSKRIETIRAP
jgi:tetratricopeptide (TPR) repeat protein